MAVGPTNLEFCLFEVDELLKHFDVLKVYRSTADADGPFVEITIPSTRIVLEADINSYSFVDPTGSHTYFYRTTYFNTTTLLESSLSDTQSTEKDAALEILSVEELKQHYLFGIDLTDDNGNPFPESMFKNYIASAVSWVEHRLDLPLVRRKFAEERHDYVREDYDKYIFMELDSYPVISVEEVKLVLPGEQVVQVFEKDWIHIQKNSGQLQLVPGTGTAGSILLGASGAWIPLIYGNNKFIPDAFRVSYTSGFKNGVPADIVDVIAKVASYGPLAIAGDLIVGAGISNQSLSMDGLVQSIGTTASSTSSGYGARILQYRTEVNAALTELRRYYKGIALRVV